jgi:hypothetical protein
MAMTAQRTPTPMSSGMSHPEEELGRGRGVANGPVETVEPVRTVPGALARIVEEMKLTPSNKASSYCFARSLAQHHADERIAIPQGESALLGIVADLDFEDGKASFTSRM